MIDAADVNNQVPAVDIEIDTSFNNRMQAGFEAATQSFTPVINANAGGFQVLDVHIANKLCKIRDCSHDTDRCKKNYQTNSSIASTEPKFLKKAIEVLETSNIQVRSVTTDGSAALKKVIREHRRPINHYVCFVHRMRTVQKRINQVKLAGNIGGNKSCYMQKLSTAVRSRVKMELTRLGRITSQQEVFVRRGSLAMRNIIPCFSGRHAKCRNVSSVCNHHLAGYHTGYLPLSKHLNLTKENEEKLQATINNVLSEEELRRMVTLKTTNKCENLHGKLFTYAPKNTCWSRNFIGLGHSAVHSAILGNGRSTITLAKRIGLKYSNMSPMTSFLQDVDINTKYHRIYKSSLQYIKKRHYARKLKSMRRQLEIDAAAN